MYFVRLIGWDRSGIELHLVGDWSSSPNAHCGLTSQPVLYEPFSLDYHLSKNGKWWGYLYDVGEKKRRDLRCSGGVGWKAVHNLIFGCNDTNQTAQCSE